MTEKLNIISLLQKAMQNQVDMGFDSVIISKKLSEKAISDAIITNHVQSQTVTVSEAVNSKNEFIMSSEYKSIDDHNKAICNCKKCPLGETRNKFVYGVGNPDADLMFVGEAPGADEDRLGEPFVGRAGQLLDKILAAIQLDRKTVYIANILKCRPPQNRDPKPEEMDLCTPYLKEQISIIKPKLICALGRIAAQSLLQTTTPLGKLRNNWHDFHSVPTLVTYHPAALLRFPSYKRDTWEDMKKLKARYDMLRGA